jgi:hypothetical protein
MLKEVVLRTNEKIASVRKKYGENKPYLVKETDVIELNVLTGLLYLSGEFKAGHEIVRTMFPPQYGRSVFRATMLMNRFFFPVSCLRLERTSDRNVRKETNKTAAIFGLSNQFVKKLSEILLHWLLGLYR